MSAIKVQQIAANDEKSTLSARCKRACLRPSMNAVRMVVQMMDMAMVRTGDSLGEEHRRKGRLRSRLKALARAPEVQAKELRQLQRYERRWPPGTESCGNAVRKPLSAPGRS